MNNYTIVIIECVGVWYPMKHVVKVKAENLENALDKTMNFLTFGSYDVPDSEQLKEAKKEAKEEFGVKGNELIALAYNKCLDDNESAYRIIKGSNNNTKIFDLMDTENETLED